MDGRVEESMPGAGGAGMITAVAAWRNLAQLANCTMGDATGARVAAGLSSDGTATQSSLAVRNVLHQILVDTRSDPKAGAVLAGLSELVLALDVSILAAVIRAENDADRHLDFVCATGERLPVEALVRFATAVASAFGREYPVPLQTLVERLAVRARTLPSPADRESDALLRQQLVALFRTWSSREGTHQRRETQASSRARRRKSGRASAEADRILEMAVECNATGASCWKATGG